MKRIISIFLFLAAAACLYFVGAMGGSEDTGVFTPFLRLTDLTLGLSVAGLVFFVAGIAFVFACSWLPEDPDELASEYEKLSQPPVCRTWELALLVNSLIAGLVFVFIFIGAVKGLDSWYLGALMSVLVLEIVISMVLVLLFFLKRDRQVGLFIPGAALSVLELLLVIFIFIKGW